VKLVRHTVMRLQSPSLDDVSPKVSVRNKLTSVLESGVTSQVIDEGERWSVPPSGPVARFSKRRG